MPGVSLGVFLEKVLIFFQFLELSPQRPVCWFLRQGVPYLEIPPHRFNCLLSNNFARASAFLVNWPVNCDFTRSVIDVDVVRVGVNIRRVKALVFVYRKSERTFLCIDAKTAKPRPLSHSSRFRPAQSPPEVGVPPWCLPAQQL